MILRYSRVDLIAPTPRWVTVADLERHLRELRGRRFVYLDDYRSPETEVAVTFDQAWENVHRHALPLLIERGIPFEVFVRSDALGRWNEKEKEEPLTRFMNARHLKDVVRGGGRLQWRTRTHAALPGLAEDALLRELTVDEDLARAYPAPHFSWLAYPEEAFDDRVLALTRTRFVGALAGVAGVRGDRFRLPCIAPDRDTCLTPASADRALDLMSARALELERELAVATSTVDALRRSTSWRLTAPLRRLVTAVRSRGGPRA